MPKNATVKTPLKNNEVKKADQEVLTLLNNLTSLVEELKQMETSEGQPGQVQEQITQDGTELDNVKNAEDEGSEEDKKEDEDEVDKALEQTESDGATANDDVETRTTQDDTETTENALEEIAKAIIAKAIGKKKEIKKSSTPTNELLKQLIAVVKSQDSRMKEMESAVVNVLKGLGIADQVMKSAQPQKQEQVVRKGLNDVTDIEKTLEFITSKLKKSEDNEDAVKSTNAEKVRKSLANPGLLSALLVRKN